jgi:AbrB family looped-hinge helix DNA binding protein
MKIDERGQVTIPKKYRSRFGLLPGMDVEFVEHDGQLFLKKTKAATPPIAKYSGILKGRGRRSDHLIEQMRGR